MRCTYCKRILLGKGTLHNNEPIGSECKKILEVENDYIKVIKLGERGYGRYRFKVLDRSGFATHHTNSIEDARQWLKRCLKYWEEQDVQSR